VWGTMAKDKAGEVGAEVRLWSRGKPQVEANESYSDNLKDPGDEALKAVAGRLFAKLTSSGSTGTLVVHAGTASGSVLVDGAGKGKLDGGVARIDLPEGSHNVVVRVPGFTAPPQTVTLQDGGEADVSFALTPGEGPAGGETSEAPQEPVEKRPFPVRKVIGYTTVVVGVGFLVAAGIEGTRWLSAKNSSDQDRNNVSSMVTDVCAPPVLTQPAADACNESHAASRAATLGWVFTGVGAVLAGAGIWLVVGDHSGDASAESTAKAKPRFDVLPAFGPRGGSLDMRMAF
jgi:hypothetical protein